MQVVNHKSTMGNLIGLPIEKYIAVFRDDQRYDQRQPGDPMFGYDNEHFCFANRRQLWQALNTPEHPLSHYPQLMCRVPRRPIRTTEMIRVDCDFNPPYVEVVRPRLVNFGRFLIGTTIVWIGVALLVL